MNTVFIGLNKNLPNGTCDNKTNFWTNFWMECVVEVFFFNLVNFNNLISVSLDLDSDFQNKLCYNSNKPNMWVKCSFGTRHGLHRFGFESPLSFWEDASNRQLLFPVTEKAMATHSSTLAWKIPWMEGPGRLRSMGSLGVGYDWATSLSLFTFMHWRRKWQPTPVFLPGESQGRGSLVGCCLWGCTESDTTEAT